jgi:hypothetical protein
LEIQAEPEDLGLADEQLGIPGLGPLTIAMRPRPFALDARGVREGSSINSCSRL